MIVWVGGRYRPLAVIRPGDLSDSNADRNQPFVGDRRPCSPDQERQASAIDWLPKVRSGRAWRDTLDNGALGDRDLNLRLTFVLEERGSS